MVPLSSQQNHRHQVFADPYVAFSKKKKKKKFKHFKELQLVRKCSRNIRNFFSPLSQGHYRTGNNSNVLIHLNVTFILCRRQT